MATLDELRIKKEPLSLAGQLSKRGMALLGESPSGRFNIGSINASGDPISRSVSKGEIPTILGTSSTVPKTIQTPADQFQANQFKMSRQPSPALPAFQTGLDKEQQAPISDAFSAERQRLQQESEQRVKEIQTLGRTKLGGAKSFLAKIGAIGRTATGAPVDSGLGVLSDVQGKINAAIREERDNFTVKEGALRSEERGVIQDKIDSLNELAQTNFNNALSLWNNEQTQLYREAQLGMDVFGMQQDVTDKIKTNASNRLSFLLENFGSEYAENNKDAIADLVQSAGFVDFDVDTMVSVMKEKEAAAEAANLPKPTLKEFDGDLYVVSTNAETGLPEMELLQKGKPSGGGQLSQWQYEFGVKEGFSSQKSEGMTMEEALDAYGPVLGTEYVYDQYGKTSPAITPKEKFEEKFYSGTLKQTEDWNKKISENPKRYTRDGQDVYDEKGWGRAKVYTYPSGF